MVDSSLIENLLTRIPSVEAELGDPAVLQDRKRYLAVLADYRFLKKLDYAYVAWQLGEATERELSAALLKPDPLEDRNAVLEIRAGTGGEEAALFAGDLFRMYSRYAEQKGWKVEVQHENKTSLNGYKEIVCLVKGEGAYGTLRFESGGHRVQRVPETETQGRIHTSAATVVVFPEADETDELDIPEKDIRIDLFCAGGAGGQHVNKTDSAVRLTHLPTGIVVACQKERSQHMNKEKALNMLRAQLYEYYEDQKRAEMDRFYGAKSANGWGSQIRSYVFCPYTMVKDLRTEVETSDVNAVMDGHIQPFIEAWLQQQATKGR